MVKIITSFTVLMQKAHELGKARLSGDAERIRVAEKDHQAYKELCLLSDEMSLNMTRGDVERVRGRW